MLTITRSTGKRSKQSKISADDLFDHHPLHKEKSLFHQIMLFFHHTRMSATIEVEGEAVTT